MSQTLPELWNKQDEWKESVSSKLRHLLDTPQTRNLDRCGREQMFRHCKGCDQVRTFEYHCDLKFCPRCNHRITARRLIVLRAWAEKIEQPKHLVLTQRNFEVLTRRQIREHTRALSRIRRTKIFQRVRGGCVSVEITNEGRGWHLHSHWLLDVNYLDAARVAVEWAKQIGQDDAAIVKIKDVRAGNYVAEVAKYVVEGSSIAAWRPEHVVEFVLAIRGQRFFFQFGSLFKEARAIRAKLNQSRPVSICECGCEDFVWKDQTTETVSEICNRHKMKPTFAPRLS